MKSHNKHNQVIPQEHLFQLLRLDNRGNLKWETKIKRLQTRLKKWKRKEQRLNTKVKAIASLADVEVPEMIAVMSRCQL
jgi:hypothetical protein